MHAIAFQQVCKRFPRAQLPALDKLNLAIGQGSIFGFLGPNGAGKSTAIKLLFGFIRPDRGTILINDRDTSLGRFQHLVGYLPEAPSLYLNLTARELLRFCCRAAGMAGGDIAPACTAMLARMDLAHAADQPARTCSKGMKQRLGLAMAMVHDPSILILDEPMSGLDPLGRRLVADVMRDLRRQGKTVFFSTHILNDISVLCDQVGLLNRGRLLFAGDVTSLREGYDSLEQAFLHHIAEDTPDTHVRDSADRRTHLP